MPTRTPLLALALAACLYTAPPAAAVFTSTLDVPYRDLPDVDDVFEQLDTYAEPGRRGAPVLLFVHGGGWKKGDKALLRERSSIIEHFVADGHAVVASNLRLVGDERSPGTTYAEQATDVAAAIGWVHQHAAELGGDPSKIVLMGYSSGAHLVALVATDPQYLAAHDLTPASLRGVIALDVSAYDIPRAIDEACDQGYCIGARNLPTVFGDDPERQRAASPIHHIRPDAAYPPFLVVSAEVMRRGTQRLSCEQSRYLVEALTAAGGRARHHHAEGETHAELVTDYGEDGDRVTAEVEAFLAELTGAPPAP